jgi:hypothetical protein
MILDDVFNNDDEFAGGEQRKLQATCGISEQECIDGKAALYRTVLASLGTISNECANLLLAPGLLQCIVAVAG